MEQSNDDGSDNILFFSEKVLAHVVDLQSNCDNLNDKGACEVECINIDCIVKSIILFVLN